MSPEVISKVMLRFTIKIIRCRKTKIHSTNFLCEYPRAAVQVLIVSHFIIFFIHSLQRISKFEGQKLGNEILSEGQVQQLKLLLNKTQLKFQFNQAKKKITKASKGRKTSSSFMVLVKGQRIQMDGTHVRTVRVNKKYPPAKRRVIKVVSASGFNFALTTDHFQKKKLPHGGVSFFRCVSFISLNKNYCVPQLCAFLIRHFASFITAVVLLLFTSFTMNVSSAFVQHLSVQWTSLMLPSKASFI